ncbi:MAG: tyrosine-type recombinase/integrase [Planctomycetota bacterium JB042]
MSDHHVPASLSDTLEAIPPRARERLLTQVSGLAAAQLELVVPPQEAVEKTLRVLEATGHSEHTLRAYRHDLDRFVWSLARRGVESIAEVELVDVRAHLAELAVAGVGPAAISRAVSAVRKLFDVAAAGHAIPHQPAELARRPSVPPGEPPVLTEAEVEAMIEAVRGPSFIEVRDAAILETLYSTGCRVAELVALDRPDLDLSRGELLLRGKGKRERLGCLGVPAVEAIREYLDVREEWLGRDSASIDAVWINVARNDFRAGRLTERSVHRIVAAAAASAGVPGHVGPHALRRAMGTHLLDRGASLTEVQRLLGHASVATTQRYTRVSTEQLMRTYAATHPRQHLSTTTSNTEAER